jgi:hypothetical protein
MGRLDDLCDEASFVDGEQDAGDLPDWQTCHRRVVDNGVSASLTHASPNNASRAFPAPVVPDPTHP